MLSRRKSHEKQREGLSLNDGWCGKICFEQEDNAKYHLDWLKSHNHEREYILVAAWPSDEKYPELDDDIPF